MHWRSSRLRWGQNAALMLRDRMPQKIPLCYIAAFWARKYINISVTRRIPIAKDMCMPLSGGVVEGMGSPHESLHLPAKYASERGHQSSKVFIGWIGIGCMGCLGPGLPRLHLKGFTSVLSFS